jgi:mersacidin/lichenicidin family type 2 lantibiotic
MIDTHTTIRAWKDEGFRLAMADADRAMLPESPAGLIELDDADLGEVAGGDAGITQTTICGTSWACVTVAAIAISKNMSCGACETTLWSGSCDVSSLGCCPAT